VVLPVAMIAIIRKVIILDGNNAGSAATMAPDLENSLNTILR
jgi:hypothetical protein